MVKISILYPNTPGSWFDFDYYTQRHMPRAIELLRAHPGYRGVSVERGLGGTEPGMPAAFSAMCHLEFNSVEDFVAAFTPHAPELQADIPNYTDLQPVIQFNDVLLSA